MCIINMSLSDEAIINHLLIETMKVERKEFEGQKRSNENDIIMHRQRLAKEHVSLIPTECKSCNALWENINLPLVIIYYFNFCP
jgi:hypothetical protein